MTKKDFEIFMYIGTEKMSICVFSKPDSKILYKNESKFLEYNDHIDENKIIKFLGENIFKLENQLNEFISDVSLIVDSKKFQLIDISIKQNIYGQVKKKKSIKFTQRFKKLCF